MSRETLKNFLNSKSLPTDSVSYVYDKEGTVGREEQVDIGTDAETGEKLLDLDTEGKGLLGDYLSYIVENAENIYGLSPGNEKAAPSNRGDSLVLAEEQGAESVFVEHGDTLSNSLESYSNSQYFDEAGTPISDILDKTGDGSHSHDLLKKVEGRQRENQGITLPSTEGDESQVVQAVHSVLANNNRFANVSNKTAFVTQGTDNADFEGKDAEEGTFLYQRNFGNFDKHEGKVSIDELKEVGASILYKITGYDVSDTPGSSEGVESIEKKIASADIASTRYAAESFEEVNFRASRAKYAAGSPEDLTGGSLRDGKGSFLPADPDADSSKTYGATYNPSLHFDGRNRKAHKIQASIACLALKKITVDFMDQISNFIRFSDLEKVSESGGDFASKDKSYEGPGPYLLGAYSQLNTYSLDIFKKLVLVRTDYSYPECFEKGIEVFFGTSGDSLETSKNAEHIMQAPGYWLSIASSIIKSYDNLSSAFSNMESFESDSSEQLSIIYDIVRSNKLVQFANAAATVGDIFFKTNNGSKTHNLLVRRPFDVDGMASTPATRVGKSRDTGLTNTTNPLSLAWRQSSVPSMYLLPRNVVKATVDLNTIVDGSNPARGMLASGLVKNTYLDREHDGSFNRIDNDVVARLEDRLDAEYVPFYIQDLRTNEVISFHAFLKTLTDNIKPSYTAVDGYGRMDPVQVYKGTTRSVGVGFTLYSTSKEDFDEMWYKINKLVTLLYPQWTQGTLLSSTGTDRFVQPFSQVLGASPIVRVRIGDVIKSNYSRFNLARMFGIGDPGVNAISGGADNVLDFLIKGAKGSTVKGFSKFQDVMTEIFYGLMGTPLQYIPSTSDTRMKSQGLRIARNFLSNGLINGFVNPIGAGLVLRVLTDPNIHPGSASRPDLKPLTLLENMRHASNSLLGATTSDDIGLTSGVTAGRRVLLKSNMTRGYRVEGGKRVFLDRPVRALIVKRLTEEPMVSAKNSLTSDKKFKKAETPDGVPMRARYEVYIIDPAADASIFGKKVEADHAYLTADPGDLFMSSGVGTAFFLAQPLSIVDHLVSYVTDGAAAMGLGADSLDLVTDLYATEPEKFMFPENNPFTRALESTGGRGLAGVIDGINFNWLDGFTWDTDYNARAPKGVEISFSLNVIHDLPPGLDHSGYNRAPLYNVGSIMQEVSGDARGNDDNAEFEYRLAGKGNSTSTGDD